MDMLQGHQEEIRRLIEQLRGRKVPPERDLARQFGISRASVRQILADLERQGLVERRQGSGTYALEAGARTLRTVIMLVDERLKLGDDPFFSLVVMELQQLCQAFGIRVLVERINESDRPATLEDGVIALGLAGRALIERLRPGSVPAVGLFIEAKPHPRARVSLLDVDNVAAGEAAGRRLVEERRTDLLFVGKTKLPNPAERLAGLRTALAAAGDGFRVQVLEAGMNYTGGLAAAEQVPLDGSAGDLSHRAIVAANDWLAMGLHAGLMRRQPRLAEDLPIISFDGLPAARDARLGIRSLAIPVDAIVQDVVSELRRLSASPAALGRRIQYDFNWTDRDESIEIPARGVSGEALLAT